MTKPKTNWMLPRLTDDGALECGPSPIAMTDVRLTICVRGWLLAYRFVGRAAGIDVKGPVFCVDGGEVLPFDSAKYFHEIGSAYSAIGIGQGDRIFLAMDGARSTEWAIDA